MLNVNCDVISNHIKPYLVKITNSCDILIIRNFPSLFPYFHVVCDSPSVAIKPRHLLTYNLRLQRKMAKCDRNKTKYRQWQKDEVKFVIWFTNVCIHVRYYKKYNRYGTLSLQGGVLRVRKKRVYII